MNGMGASYTSESDGIKRVISSVPFCNVPGPFNMDPIQGKFYMSKLMPRLTFSVTFKQQNHAYFTYTVTSVVCVDIGKRNNAE